MNNTHLHRLVIAVVAVILLSLFTAPVVATSASTDTVQQGGVAEIQIEMPDDGTATVIVGDEDEYGYQANLTISSDSETVTLRMNTYTAGRSGETFTLAPDSSGSVSVEYETDTSSTGILDPNVYPINVYDGATTDGLADGLGSVKITDNNFNVSVYTTGVETEYETTNELSKSIKNNETSLPTQNVTLNDAIVFKFNLESLQGYFVKSGVYGRLGFERAISDGLIDFSFTQTNPSPNTDPRTLDLRETNYRSQYNRDTGVFIIVIEEPDMVFNQNSAQLEGGERFELSAGLNGLPLDGDDASEHTVTTTIQFNARYLRITESPLIVEPDSNQKIRIQTNAAPGNTFDIRIELSESNSPFVATSTVETTRRNGFTITRDFSQQQDNDEFTLTVTDQSGGKISTTGQIKTPPNISIQNLTVSNGSYIATLSNTGGQNGTVNYTITTQENQLVSQRITIESDTNATVTGNLPALQPGEEQQYTFTIGGETATTEYKASTPTPTPTLTPTPTETRTTTETSQTDTRTPVTERSLTQTAPQSPPTTPALTPNESVAATETPEKTSSTTQTQSQSQDGDKPFTAKPVHIGVAGGVILLVLILLKLR